MNFIRGFGLSKEPVFDGTGYEPSEFSRKLFITEETDYDDSDYEARNTDTAKKILVICTDEKYLVMNNGKNFPLETTL